MKSLRRTGNEERMVDKERETQIKKERGIGGNRSLNKEK